MRKATSALMFWALVFAAFATTQSLSQSACTNLNRGPGEGKFTGQVSSNPDGSSMQVSYGGQTVLVHYGSSVTVCQGGQPGSLAGLARGASVSVMGPAHGVGNNMEIDATRIFISGSPRMSRPGAAANPAGAAAAPAFNGAAAPNAQPSAISSAMPRMNPGSVADGQPAPGRTMTPGAVPNARPAPVTRMNPGSAANAQPAEVTRTSGAMPMTRSGPLPAMKKGVVAGSVVLTGGTHAQTMARLHVVRTYSLPNLRSNSQVGLGQVKLDFQPMLGNPQAVFNVAERLRALPQHVQVIENTSEISEVDQGLVIHHSLTYRILPGKCGDANAAAQIARAGASCFTRSTVNDRMTEFSRPGNARYIADAGKRQAGMAKYQQNVALEQNDANKGIAALRAALSNPQQRAAIVAQMGEEETARMQALNDDQLKEELINSGVQQVEETMFVPKLASARYAHSPHNVTSTGSSGEMTATEAMMRDGVTQRGSGSYPKLLRMVPARSLSAGGGKPADADLGTYYFLTGFTIGNDYEWSWGEQVTIDWCVVGCASTYGLELHAGFNYGFGLRFPIQTKLTYKAAANGQNSAAATVTADFDPIQGNVADFSATGLGADQMFNAKELVAQIGADAGFDLSLPGLNVDPDVNVGIDFTNYLPAPYTGGSFQPPAPGAHGIDSVLILDGLDLLGGMLNYGVAGGQVLPAAKLNLHSDKLQLTFHDEMQSRQTLLTRTPQTVPVSVEAGGGQDSSHFSVGDPVYNLGFTITPGLNPQVFVDIAVWSHQWNWQIWFPQLSITLPPNGIDFSCHAGTTCVLDFQTAYNPGTGQVAGNGQDVTRGRQVAYNTLTGGGCTADSEQQSDFLCPLKGMYGLCETMLKNGAVASCGALVLPVVDHILKNGHCTGSAGNYGCPSGMMGLCQTYIKNQQVLSCKKE